MKKILVSWLATNHDFLKKSAEGEMIKTDDPFNEEGPHLSLYKDFGGDYERHYLLSQHKNEYDDPRIASLASYIRLHYNTQVIVKYMAIGDILSVGSIEGKVKELVRFQLKDQNVEVFVSPGTPAMQTAWYLLGAELAKRNNILFFKRREKRFIQGGGIPPKEKIAFDVSNFARVSNIRDRSHEKDAHGTPFFTSSYKEAYTKALQLAGNHSTTVLIQGEMGTGKGHLARYIHRQSNRNTKDCRTINCAGYREDLLENRLFGYEAGAFDGAKKLTTGILEQTGGGTVILEEVDTLPLRIQVQLVEVLSTRTYTRLGSNKAIPLDIRLIATTTRNLSRLCQEGAFRWDLYHRLSIAELELVPFATLSRKERKQWVEHFMEKTYTRLEKDYIDTITKEAWDFLLGYSFLGNFRELANTVEAFYTFCEKKITLEDIPKVMRVAHQKTSLSLDEAIKRHVRMVVDRYGGNVVEASKALGRDRGTVTKWLK